MSTPGKSAACGNVNGAATATVTPHRLQLIKGEPSDHDDDSVGSATISDCSSILASDQESSPPEVEPSSLIRRCVRHNFNAISTVILELIFVEEVIGIVVATGIEHVKFRFCHDRADSSATIKARYLEEYEKAGYMELSRANLKRKKMKRAAKELKRTKTVRVRRNWIFSTEDSNHDEVQRAFYIVAKAAELVCTLLAVGHRVVPAGEFKGQHLEFLTPEVKLNGRHSASARYLEDIFDSVNHEQSQTFGIVNDVRCADPAPLRFLSPGNAASSSSGGGSGSSGSSTSFSSFRM